MDKPLFEIATEFITELTEAPLDDYLQTKLMMLSATRSKAADVLLHRIFQIAEERRPLLIEAN
nr:hypothetical protein [uncultured Blautia sp.]